MFLLNSIIYVSINVLSIRVEQKSNITVFFSICDMLRTHEYLIFRFDLLRKNTDIRFFGYS